MSIQLISREIDRTKLPKRATNILHKLDRYIDFFNRQPSRPASIKVYPKDFEFLAEKLKDTGQDIRFALYRGYCLEMYAE